MAIFNSYVKLPEGRYLAKKQALGSMKAGNSAGVWGQESWTETSTS